MDIGEAEFPREGGPHVPPGPLLSVETPIALSFPFFSPSPRAIKSNTSSLSPGCSSAAECNSMSQTARARVVETAASFFPSNVCGRSPLGVGGAAGCAIASNLRFVFGGPRGFRR